MENRWPPDSVKSLVTPWALSRLAIRRPPWTGVPRRRGAAARKTVGMVALVEAAQALLGVAGEDRPLEAVRLDGQALRQRPAVAPLGGLQVGAQRRLGQRGDR